MPETCCAVGCHNRRDGPSSISFYRIPAEKNRRERWIAAIKRDGWKPSDYTRLCSAHFIAGAKSEDPLSPDYVPSVFSHIKSPQKRKNSSVLKAFDRRKDSKKRRAEHKSRQEAAGGLLGLGNSETDDTQDQEIECESGIGVQTDLTSDAVSSMLTECQTLRSENIQLKAMGQKFVFDIESLVENDQKVIQCTGISSYAVLMVLFKVVEPYMKDKSLTKSQQFIMTLLRMRFNLSHVFLSYVYGVHASTLSRIFLDVINIFNDILVPILLFWPDKDQVHLSMPMCFRLANYDKCISIIDCFEIFIEKPSDLKARAQTYSNYKSHNTIKFLISITPQGFISFVSKGWGGRTSDKYVTEHSGYLNYLLPGDVVLADRGFNIRESVAVHGASLDIPAFTKGKKQLDPLEVEKTREIANVRIHVERIIGMLRQKYSILESTIPITYLKKIGNLTTLDRIVRVASALCNVSTPIVPTE